MAAERDAAIRERDQALARRIGPPRPRPEPVLSPLALWTPRLVAIGILFLMLLTVLIVFRGG